jgi:hypothetical protein
MAMDPKGHPTGHLDTDLLGWPLSLSKVFLSLSLGKC